MQVVLEDHPDAEPRPKIPCPGLLVFQALGHHALISLFSPNLYIHGVSYHVSNLRPFQWSHSMSIPQANPSQCLQNIWRIQLHPFSIVPVGDVLSSPQLE